MTIKLIVLHVILASFIMTSCYAQENEKLSTKDILESIKTGDEAAQIVLPYGLTLYPDAKITTSLLGGLSIGVETKARTKQLAEFYTADLKKLGYKLEKRETKGKKITLSAVKDDDKNEMMVVIISPSKRSKNQYNLVFIQLIN